MHAGSIQVRLLGILIIGVCCSYIACSGGASASPSPSAIGHITISLSPSSPSVLTGTTLDVRAAVSGTSNTDLTWMVDNIPQGDASVGTITGSGTAAVYTAPGVVGTHLITATSVADPNQSGSVKIEVKATLVSVVLEPSIVSVPTSGNGTLIATVTGSTNTGVTWAVDGIAGGNATVGTVTGTGNAVTYTAPAVAGTHTVRATSVADTSQSASSMITVQAPVLVTLSPTSASISTGATVSLTATVVGTTNTGVSWTVDSIAGGNATVGAITGTGNTVTYTAPATAGSHTVVATSVADPRQTVSSSISVLAAAPITVTLSPSTITVAVSTGTSFTASVSGTTNTGVTWAVDGITNGNSTVGTIAGSGNTVTYTAPAASGTHTLKATSVQDSSKYSTASVVVSSASTVTLGPLAAFPGSEGMGSGATGGRGGDVYTVNTLEDATHSGVVPQNGPNGPTCSLRDAMMKSGPRTIVFSVSGTITLHSTIYSVPPGLTIAGQTAPGGGIQIKGDGTFGSGGALLWYGGNTIIRYLRIRPGNAPLNSSSQGLTGMASLDSNADDVIFDHNSFEWDGNKAVSWWSASGVRRNTFSWNLVAECMAPHSTGLLVGAYSMGQTNLDQSSWDAHHNVLATIDHRLPQTNIKFGRWINNYVFGYGYAMLVRGGAQFDIIGNVWDGMASGIKSDPAKNEVRWADTLAHNEYVLLPSGTAQIYMNNNFGPHNPLGTLDDYTTMFRIASSENSQLDDNVVDSQYKATSPTILSSLNAWPISISTLASKEDLKNLLTPTVGAYRRLACDGSWVVNRDSVDSRIIAYIKAPSTSPTSLVSTAGPYPDLSGGTACADADGDGMPDVWEDAHGLNKTDPSDRNTIRSNARGYTNLELYLSGLFPNGTPLP